MLFFPYLFMAKWIHMPDQDEVKSGQRFADGMLWFAGALMAVTGVILMLGSTVLNLGTGYGVVLLLHDLAFCSSPCSAWPTSSWAAASSSRTVVRTSLCSATAWCPKPTLCTTGVTGLVKS